MNYNKFKRSVQDLKMPDDMKKRIISNCERISENKAPSIEGYEEHYHFTAERVYPHPIRKALSVAAACALIVGGIGGTTYLISRNGSPNNEFSNTEENYKISPFGDFRELDFFIYEFEFNDQQRIKIADYLNNCDWKMINGVEGKDTRLSDVTFDSNDEEADSETIEDTSESNDDTVYLDNEEVYCTIGVNTDNNSDFAITVYQSGISEVSHKENRSYLELYEVNITEFSNEINRILNENSLSADSFWENVTYILTPEKTEITEEQREFLNKIWNESVIQPISEDSFVKSDNILFTIVSEESESLSYSLIIYDNRNAELFKTENDISETISYYEIEPSDLVVNINQMTGHSPVGDLRNMPVSRSVKGEAFTTDKSQAATEMSSEKKEKLAELLDSLEWNLSETQSDSFIEEASWTIDFGTFNDSVYHNYMTISDVNGGLIKVLLYGKIYSYDIDFEYVDSKLTEIFGDGKIYRELEIFNGIPTIENDEQQGALVVPEEFYIEDNLYDRIGINRQPYILKLLSSDKEALNDAEIKSYIYHMMLNSVDYFDTAEGKGYIGLSDQLVFDFKTNIPEQKSYEEVYQNGELIDEYEFFIGKPPLIEKSEITGKTNITEYNTQLIDRFPIDSYRICMGSDETGVAEGRHDWTNLPYVREFLLPQNFAKSRLSDFNTWEITGIEEKLGRKCAVIEGNSSRGEFIIHIDIETGIMISYIPTDPDNTYASDYVLTELDVKVRDF